MGVWAKTTTTAGLHLQALCTKMMDKGAEKNRRKDGNEEPIVGSSMKKTYNDTQRGGCGLIGHNSRNCAKQGVARRPKHWIDTEPEEQVQGNVASVETVENVATEVQQENVVTDNNGPVTNAVSRQV